VPINQGPPPGVQGAKWFPEEDETAKTGQEKEEKKEGEKTGSDDAEEMTGDETKEKQSRTLPLPPATFELAAEIEAGDAAASVDTDDAAVESDLIAWAKSRVAAHNDLMDAKAMVEAAGKANPAPSPGLPHSPPAYTVLPQLTTTVPAMAAVTTIPGPQPTTTIIPKAAPATTIPGQQPPGMKHRPHPRNFV